MKGLQGFLDRCCPEACVPVNLKEMARRHVSQSKCTSTSHMQNESSVTDYVSVRSLRFETAENKAPSVYSMYRELTL